MKIVFAGDWLCRRPLMERVCRNETIAVGNLECAFSDNEINSGKAYAVILPVKCMGNVVSGGFSALSVANNHVNDAGNFTEKYVELVKKYTDIQFFGTKEVPCAEFCSGNERIIVIGCLEPCRSRGDFVFKQEDVTALIRQLRMSQPPTSTRIFVYPHWGKEGEYTRYPAPWQLRLAREWIDAGADGVFGSHSHVPQGREYYKGKPIYYSLGNFNFDHPESKLYEGTEDRLRLVVEVENGVCVREQFNTEQAREAVVRASKELAGLNTWKWAQKVGPFNLKKNTASWKLRLKKNYAMTLPKFIAWQFLPKTVLFRIAGLCCCKR